MGMWIGACVCCVIILNENGLGHGNKMKENYLSAVPVVQILQRNLLISLFLPHRIISISVWRSRD